MKFSLSVLLVLFSAAAIAQPTLVEKFQKIGTAQQAQQFVDANPDIKPAILRVPLSKKDDSLPPVSQLFWDAILTKLHSSDCSLLSRSEQVNFGGPDTRGPRQARLPQ